MTSDSGGWRDEFTCAICGETYVKALTDQQAEEQLAVEFPGWSVEACALVCDDCFQRRAALTELARVGEEIENG